MKRNLEKLIQLACLQNASLKTVIKARHKLNNEITTAIDLINELIRVNAKIDKTRNKFDESLCDKSAEIFEKLRKMDVFKHSAKLTDLFDHTSDQQLIHKADDLIDLIDETTGKIVAKHNPLKGKQFSPIPH